MIGEVLSHYRIVRKLGEGGMGEVFLAEDTALDREVAIKILPESFRLDLLARKRFFREAKLAAALDHPYICSIHELLDVGGDSCIVMEYVEGQTLKERLASGAIPVRDALRMGLEIAEALEKAHQKGIIHRDLKPANLMLTPEGHVKVMDFGLARYIETGDRAPLDETRTALTQNGMTAGTLAYMSPEQIQGHTLTPASDLFALGVVLCELLTGVHPFKHPQQVETAHAIVHSTPASLSVLPPQVPDDVRRLLGRLLSKEPGERGTVQAVRSCLAGALQDEPSSPTLVSALRRTVSRPSVAILSVVVLVVASYLGYQRFEHNRKTAWARDVALPEIARLTENGETLAAFNLATDAERYLSKDTKAFVALLPVISRAATVSSNPPGAAVWWKDYAASDSSWRLLGETPISGVRVPAIVSTVRVEKDGYQPLVLVTPFLQPLAFALDKTGSLPRDMVRVPETLFNLPLPGLDHMKAQTIGGFLIDKFEVTNRAYKTFVDAGGYRDKRYWKHPFETDGPTLTWEEAMQRFTDRTGRPGPATWEAGDYPEGQDERPVSGVSWYEAAAYAEYAGKTLPTIYHWYTAAGMGFSASIVPLSNLGGTTGTAAVGTYRGVGPYGTYDMAGNVREWCLNAGSTGNHFILGGGWNDPPYAFDSDAYTQPPFDRSATNGFRCIKHLGTTEQEAAAARAIQLSFRDFFKEKPSSDAEFGVFLRQYAYDKTPLNAKILGTDTSSDEWTKEKITFDAAYGSERVLAYLYLPRRATPPYQVVLCWPGDSGLQMRSSDNLQVTRTVDFIVKSGRAVLYPVFKSMFERADGLDTTVPNESIGYKEHVVMWVKDVRRSIDYLETRQDIDTRKLAFFGTSWGGRMSGVALAVDRRFKVAVLYVAGFRFPRSMPEVDPFNFVPHVTIPVLMLNGKYDHYFPTETAQKPMFMLLGTPKEHKNWITYDGGHFVPRDQLIKETLLWLDRYLGAVR